MNVSLAITLPNDFVQMLTPAVIEREMRISYALTLFKTSRITLSKAAELADMTIYDFIKVCKENQIAVIDISREELMQELESMRQP
jgi:predicted HTH domain antitoxin